VTIVLTLMLVAFAAVATLVGYFPLVIVVWLAIALCLFKLSEEAKGADARRRK
jgi:hypothetical protein